MVALVQDHTRIIYNPLIIQLTYVPPKIKDDDEEEVKANVLMNGNGYRVGGYATGNKAKVI